MTATPRYARILIKPDGMARMLTTGEVGHVVNVWNGLLDHLAGLPPTRDTPHGLIAELPGKIERRRDYRPGYDLRTWSKWAAAAPRYRTAATTSDVRTLLSDVLDSAGLTRVESAAGVIEPAGVQTIYAASKWFAEDPHGLAAYLRSGPVGVDIWHGAHIELALAAKFAVRWALGVSGRLNLVHCDLIAAFDKAGVAQLLGSGDAGRHADQESGA